MDLQFTTAQLVPLRDAIQRYTAEPGAPVNAYDWYRRDAHQSGAVFLADRRIPAFKLGRSWFVNATDIAGAIEALRGQQDRVKQATADYERGVLRGQDGQDVRTEWGGHRLHGAFHFAWSDYERLRRRSDGDWYCNTCMKAVQATDGRLVCPRCGVP